MSVKPWQEMTPLEKARDALDGPFNSGGETAEQLRLLRGILAALVTIATVLDEDYVAVSVRSGTSPEHPIHVSDDQY